MSQGSLNLNIRFLGQKVCPVARGQTHTKVNTEGTLKVGFSIFSFNSSSRIGPINEELKLSLPFLFDLKHPIQKVSACKDKYTNLGF